MPLREFWVVYNYGMGGAWGLAKAASPEEVARVLPELKIINGRPDWMTAKVEDDIRRNRSFVVSDPQTYPRWVKTLVDER